MKPLRNIIHRSIIIVFLFAFVSAFGQDSNSLQPLKIGDKVPDILLSMINYKDSTAKLSDFDGKHILLDFWATWCGSCIGAFPKLEALQRKYPDDLKIILASADKEKSLRDFYSKKENLILPTARYDRSDPLAMLFPHREIPHYVWIDKDRKIYAITDYSYANEENIKRFLDNQPSKMEIKTDSLLFTDFRGQVIDSIERHLGNINRISIDSNIMYQSYIRRYDPRLTRYSAVIRSGALRYRFVDLINYSVTHLFQVAYGIITSEDRTKLYYDIQDSTLLYPDANYRQWEKRYSYTYRLILPEPDSILRHKIMQRDFEMMFSHVKARYQKMEVPCLILKKTGNNDKEMLAKVKDSVYRNSSPYHIDLSNQPVGMLINMLDQRGVGRDLKMPNQNKIPIIDETGIKDNVTFSLENIADIRDLTLLNQALEEVGLVLTPEKRELEVLIITDKPEIYSQWKL